MLLKGEIKYDIADLKSLIHQLNNSLKSDNYTNSIWDVIQYETAVMSREDLKVSSLMANAILSQPSFEEALINFVSNQLETPLFQATQIRNLFADVCLQNQSIITAWSFDLLACAIRDDAQANMLGVLLFNQGFHALVAYRIANFLWYNERDGLARYFQSLISRAFGADIHPACHIGRSCSVSSGSGIVIGETASIGSDCSIGSKVTLGGTGKECGDRHPKLGNGVSVRSGATILGNIYIGEGAIIEASSVVIKPVAPYTKVSGVPAKVIGNYEYPVNMDYNPNDFVRSFPKIKVCYHENGTIS